jgi:hypothetical protein
MAAILGARLLACPGAGVTRPRAFKALAPDNAAACEILAAHFAYFPEF